MALNSLLSEIKQCRVCVDQPLGQPLPHHPRPVLRVCPTARLAIVGQAPGTRVHASGKPFTDPSGERLRAWMGVSEAEFYDRCRVAIIPMGFCFPGLNDKGGDLPPRKECAPTWRHRVFAELPNLELVLLVGLYAQRWHLGPRAHTSLTDTVADWRTYRVPDATGRCYLPVPHPSWRNNHWLKTNPWFEDEVLPSLRRDVRRVLK